MRARADASRLDSRGERLPHTGVWENRRVTIQWKTPEYTLTAGLDDRGRIVSLWLMRPECFPDECHWGRGSLVPVLYFTMEGTDGGVAAGNVGRDAWRLPTAAR